MRSCSVMPLRRFGVLRDRPIDELQSAGASWLTPTRITARSQAVHATMAATSVGPLGVVYAGTAGGVTAADHCRAETSYVVAIPLRGRNELAVDDEAVVVTHSTAAVTSPGQRIAMETSEDHAQLLLVFEQGALERQLARLTGTGRVRPIRFRTGMALDRPAAASWRRGVQILLRDLDEGGLSQGPTAGPWPDFLMTGLLLAQPHDLSDELHHERQRALRPRTLRRVLEHVEADPADDWSLSALCEIAGVGTRTLQRAFRDHLGLSPSQYVRQIRLERAHHDLQEGRGATVAEVAMRWGFLHTARFAAAYRARYGAVPSATLRASA